MKLGQTLSSLIERGGYSRNRRDILTALDISPAALSQYARNQTRPSFQKLVALADFFGVSLDYLVYGQPMIDHSTTTGYIESTWQRVMANTRRHSALVGRMGRLLADRVDEVARELANSPTAGREGLIQDDEAARLERFCLSADILTLNLDFDMVNLPDGSAAAGRFMDVVAMNLLAGCTYRFLVPVDSEHVIEQFRLLLVNQVGRDLVRRNCSFRRTAQPVYSGMVIYRLDLGRLGMEEPALLTQMQDYIGAHGELGYVIRPNEDSNSDMMMSNGHRNRAKAAFNTLWASGRHE
ncbi:helix-turn-helix protein [Umezawaea tangerina]|uniref:Helix-turn-helix protein n=1 Tax=Umezawaea tangerina TaxID=84725 RepID=A0A2T0SBY8_9PSEU|nr:helix-turn-helix protein [Umezawaea tangerina]